MHLISALSTFCILSVTIAEEAKIFSTGKFQSIQFKWAFGVPELTFNYTPVHNDEYDWVMNGKVVAYVEGNKCSPTAVTCGTEAMASCTGGWDSTLKIDCELDIGNWSLSVNNMTTEQVRTSRTISISYCDSLTSDLDHALKVENGLAARYNTIATFSCETTASHKLFVNKSYVDHETYHVLCDAYASWNGTDIVQCHYAPIPSISLLQDGNVIGDEDVLANTPLTVNCSIDKEGNPTEICKIVYYLGNETKNATFEVTPDHNGLNISCQVFNDYVLNGDSSSGFSSARQLNVIFKPMGDTEYNDYANAGDEFFIVFNFTANPQLNTSNVKLYFEGKQIKNNNSLNVSSGIYHSFTHSISSVNKTDFGVYTLSTVSPDSRLNSIVNFTVTLNSTQYTPAPQTTSTEDMTPVLPLGTLIGVCVASVVAIAIIVLFLIWKIRKLHSKADDTGREERDNPLYGSAPAPDNQAEYASVDKKRKKKQAKEERANPLYQTSGPDTAGIEEAYGTVGRDDAGADNAAFRSESIEVTYAAVNKQSKNKPQTPEGAVYSTVDKGKKKGGGDHNVVSQTTDA